MTLSTTNNDVSSPNATALYAEFGREQWRDADSLDVSSATSDLWCDDASYARYQGDYDPRDVVIPGTIAHPIVWETEPLEPGEIAF